jgi:hypothetical protein
MSTLELPPRDEHPLDPVWWAPLVAVAALVAGNEDHRFFDIADFMLLARLKRGSRPRIFLYKHAFTRHDLNLDELGNAYRYVAPGPNATGRGQYRKLPDIDQAVSALRLWELPWMKPGLEDQRCGLDWDHRVPLRPEHVARWKACGSYLPPRDRWPADAWDDDYDDDAAEADAPMPAPGPFPARRPAVSDAGPAPSTVEPGSGSRQPRTVRRGRLRLVR